MLDQTNKNRFCPEFQNVMRMSRAFIVVAAIISGVKRAIARICSARIFPAISLETADGSKTRVDNDLAGLSQDLNKLPNIGFPDNLTMSRKLSAQG